MAEKIGIVGFSFALRKNQEPNPCNARLYDEVARAVAHLRELGHEPVVVLQWEVELARRLAEHLEQGKHPQAAHVVWMHREKGQYLDSDEVMAQAAEIFRREGVTRVIPIANPFVHIIKCRMLVRKCGFALYQFATRWIGFDKDSDQPWTRGPIRLVTYTVRQVLFGYRGPAQ